VTEQNEDLEQYREIYGRVKTIAVVGASNNPTKPAYSIPRYLKSEGFTIIPVNPNEKEVQGEPTFDSVEEIDEPVDVVDVFRSSAETPDIARSAAKIGAKVLWLQEGIHSDEAEQIARDAGMTFVSNRCMGETHWALFHKDDG
jgi:predicted CoA-binding protein